MTKTFAETIPRTDDALYFFPAKDICNQQIEINKIQTELLNPSDSTTVENSRKPWSHLLSRKRTSERAFNICTISVKFCKF